MVLGVSPGALGGLSSAHRKLTRFPLLSPNILVLPSVMSYHPDSWRSAWMTQHIALPDCLNGWGPLGLPLPTHLVSASLAWCPWQRHQVYSCSSCWPNFSHLCTGCSPDCNALCPGLVGFFLPFRSQLKCRLPILCCCPLPTSLWIITPYFFPHHMDIFGILLLGFLFLICFLTRMKAPGRQRPPLLSSLLYWKT